MLNEATQNAALVLNATEMLEKAAKMTVDWGPMVQLKATLERFLSENENEKAKAKEEAEKASTYIKRMEKTLSDTVVARKKAENVLKAAEVATTLTAAQAAAEEANEALQIVKTEKAAIQNIPNDFFNGFKPKEDETLYNADKYTILYQR